MSHSNNKNDEQLTPYFHQDHPRPRTRREFLAQGFLGSSGLFMLPSVFTLLNAQVAESAECVTSALTQKTPVLCFDLGGGAGIAGSNVMVGKAGGQEDFLPNYSGLGLPPEMFPQMPGQVNRDLGLVFHSDSGILKGIQSTTTAQTRANLEGAIFCAISNDDTANNPHNPMYWLSNAGSVGELVNLVGTRSSESGGRSKAPINSVAPSLRPVRIARATDATGLIGLGRLETFLNKNKALKVMESINRLSQSKIQKIAEQTLPEQIKTLMECGYIQGHDRVSKFNADTLDFTKDPIIMKQFNASGGAGLSTRVSAISKLVIDGFAGAGTIEAGGYDYHTGERATGERKDFEIGVQIGAAIQTAAEKNKDLVIYVFTDGAVYSRGTIDNSVGGRGKGNWNGDAGDRSASFMLVYSSTGKPKLRIPGKRQVGHFNDSGKIDFTASQISDNVENLVKAMVLNYLALHGEEGRLDEVVGLNPFGTSTDKYIVFDKLSS
jgi:hypothetical protein